MPINTGLSTRPSTGLLAATVLGSAVEKYVARQHEKEKQAIRESELAKEEQLRRDQLAQQQGQFETTEGRLTSQFGQTLSLQERKFEEERKTEALRRKKLQAELDAAIKGIGKIAKPQFKTQGDAVKEVLKFPGVDNATAQQAGQLLFNYQDDPNINLTTAGAIQAVETGNFRGIVATPIPEAVDKRMETLISNGEVSQQELDAWFDKNDQKGQRDYLRNVAFRRSAGETNVESKIGAVSELVEERIRQGLLPIDYPYTADEKVIPGADLLKVLYPDQAQQIASQGFTSDEDEEFASRTGVSVNLTYSLNEALRLVAMNVGPENAPVILNAAYGVLAPYYNPPPQRPGVAETLQKSSELQQALERIGRGVR